MPKVTIHKQTSDPLQKRSSITAIPADNGAFKQYNKVVNTKQTPGKLAGFDEWKKSQMDKGAQVAAEFNAGKGGSPGQAPGWLGTAANAVSSITKPFAQMNTTASQTSLSIRDTISDAAIQSGNPYAMAIGAATKIVDAIGDATGFHIDDIDKDAGNRAGVNGGIRFLNNAMNAIPGNSLIMAAFSPGKTMEADKLNDYGEDVASAYSGSQNDISAASKLAGKRTLFGIGRSTIDDFINKSNSQASIINEIGRTNSLAKRSDYSTNIAQQNLNRYAGTNYQTYAVGKRGMKIMSKKELQDILATRKLQKGGVIGTDTNIIPEGSLHARLNHMEEVNPELAENITRKGIPVLDEQGNQVAEIEKDELCLSKTITDEVERLMKIGDDDAMIACGRLLTREIIENTADPNNLIKNE